MTKKNIFIVGNPKIDFQTHCPYCKIGMNEHIDLVSVTCKNPNCKKSFPVNPALYNIQTYLTSLYQFLKDKNNKEVIVQFMEKNRILAETIINNFTKPRPEGIAICFIKEPLRKVETYKDKFKCPKCIKSIIDKSEKEIMFCPHCGTDSIPSRTQREINVLQITIKLFGQNE